MGDGSSDEPKLFPTGKKVLKCIRDPGRSRHDKPSEVVLETNPSVVLGIENISYYTALKSITIIFCSMFKTTRGLKSIKKSVW